MPKKIELEIKEDLNYLLDERRRASNDIISSRIQMLILIKQGTYCYLTEVSKALSRHIRTVHNWVTMYRDKGIEGLLGFERGGNRKAVIQGDMYEELKLMLADPTNQITSYVELHQWLKDKGVEIKYKAMYKFVRAHFKTKLKVGRKSNIKKDKRAVALFKNGGREDKTYC